MRCAVNLYFGSLTRIWLLEEHVYPRVDREGRRTEIAKGATSENGVHQPACDVRATDLCFGLITGDSDRYESFRFHRMQERHAMLVCQPMAESRTSMSNG